MTYPDSVETPLHSTQIWLNAASAGGQEIDTFLRLGTEWLGSESVLAS